MRLICGNQDLPVEDVIRKYTNVIYKLAMVRAGNKSDAEEIVQDTFLRLISQVKKGITFNDEEHLKAWLLKVAINRTKSILTLAWNQRTEGLDSVREVAGNEKKEDYAYEYVMKLPEKYRIAIYLFYYEQLSTEQIADHMGAKPATVRSYLLRGREKLKKMMEEDGYVG